MAKGVTNVLTLLKKIADALFQNVPASVYITTQVVFFGYGSSEITVRIEQTSIMTYITIMIERTTALALPKGGCMLTEQVDIVDVVVTPDGMVFTASKSSILHTFV